MNGYIRSLVGIASLAGISLTPVEEYHENVGVYILGETLTENIYLIEKTLEGNPFIFKIGSKETYKAEPGDTLTLEKVITKSLIGIQFLKLKITIQKNTQMSV